MKFDPYSLCTCGSGKNSKWCCIDDYPVFLKTSMMVEAGQKDLALRTMEAHSAKQPNNAKVLVMLARLYFNADQNEKSLEIVDKALALDPKQPSAHFLRGMLKFGTEEWEESSRNLRSSAEYYPDKQHESLKLVYGITADLEQRRNNFVAMRKALQSEIQHDHGNTQRKSLFQQFFESPNELPKAATREYTLKGPNSSHQAAWEAQLKNVPPMKLMAHAEAYKALAAADRTDLAARYNLAITRAWLGQNLEAIAEIDSLIDDESDENQRIDLAAFRAILSIVPGCEEACDLLCHEIAYSIVYPKQASEVFRTLQEQKRMAFTNSDEEIRVMTAALLKPENALKLTEEAELLDPYCTVMIGIQKIVLQAYRESSVDEARKELDSLLGFAVEKPVKSTRFIGFGGPFTNLLPLYSAKIEPTAALRKVIGQKFSNYFEEIWTQMPCKALSGATPREASDDPRKSRRLEGIIHFWEDIAILDLYGRGDIERSKALTEVYYDFNNLRHKLGLKGITHEADTTKL